MKGGILISICIPAYKNTTFLKRLLDSISIQSFKNFEVIITDDSPDDSVKEFTEHYTMIPNLHYHRNANSLGTPENWNEAIRKASGTWIKIMHDDDWFAEPDSLRCFADATVQPDAILIFSAYRNMFIETGEQREIYPSAWRIKSMIKEPYTLFAQNIVGPPSVVMHRNDKKMFYDNRTKWVVDIDFYIRYLSKGQIKFIGKPLINVGMSSEQVTVDCVNNRKIQLPENFYLLNKVGFDKLNNIHVYDGWWRLLRNLEVTEEAEIRVAGYDGVIPAVVIAMVKTQRSLGRKLLRIGIFSKLFMMVHYITNRNKITR